MSQPNQLNAPRKWIEWLRNNRTPDKRTGWLFPYHPRSGTISSVLCRLILQDIYDRCPVLQEQAARGEVAYSLDKRFTWVKTGKVKKSDLAIGQSKTPIMGLPDSMPEVDALSTVLISMEAKATMTEHSKSGPRLFDELSSSHEIVHQGYQDAIAAGVEVVNIAAGFVSPTRQERNLTDPIVSPHKQPRAAEGVVKTLRGLRIRNQVGEVGFDAFCQFVVNMENRPVHLDPQPVVELWELPPAPQPGDIDHYETFLDRIARFYTERFSDLSNVDVEGRIEEAP